MKNRRVALRKESVDRNTMRRDFKALGLLSLSARRAWIEMSVVRFASALLVYVALRKESVDRNSTALASTRACTSRSPQGERG